jgi:hypothetical protein
MKKMWANFQRIVKKLLKIWSWDPGVKKHPIPDPGKITELLNPDPEDPDPLVRGMVQVYKTSGLP